jgi:heme-degrading monooxygenase HmoA
MTVPLGSKEEYLRGLLQTHAFIETLDGLGSQLLLQGEEADGMMKVLTVAEWQEEAALRSALEAVRRRHAELHYDNQERLRRLGIAIELMDYSDIRR